MYLHFPWFFLFNKNEHVALWQSTSHQHFGQFYCVFEKEIVVQLCNFDFVYVYWVHEHDNILFKHTMVLQNLTSVAGDRVVDQYKASYSPHHPAHQPKMFTSQATHQEGQLDHLQREFLDSAQRESYSFDLVAG